MNNYFVHSIVRLCVNSGTQSFVSLSDRLTVHMFVFICTSVRLESAVFVCLIACALGGFFAWGRFEETSRCSTNEVPILCLRLCVHCTTALGERVITLFLLFPLISLFSLITYDGFDWLRVNKAVIV